MLTTDGNYLKKFNTKDDFLAEYQNSIGNYIREIPLNEAPIDGEQLILNDYFPISGVFIRIPFSLKSIPSDLMPKIEMEAEFVLNVGGKMRRGQASQMIPATEISFPSSNYRYLDLSLGVDTLERFPSRMIKIEVPKGFIERFKNASLMTVHYYSLKNANFKEVLKESRSTGPLIIETREQ
jgi:hypothetical protein